MILRICLLLAVLFTLGCGSGAEENHVSSTYQYEFSLNECKTGTHVFNSVQEECDGLRDEKLNQGCARSFREDHFKALHCVGEFG